MRRRDTGAAVAVKRGILGLDVATGAEIEAPASGVQLGTGQGGTVTLRLFRLAGTRIALCSRVLPAQLIAVRATAAGTPVHVVTGRPQLWEPLLRRAPGCRVVADAGEVPPSSGPCVFVDDRPAVGRAPIEVRPWQCRIDVRTQWTPTDLATFAHADLTIFGAVPPDSARLVRASFALPRRSVELLSRLDSNSFGVVRRAHLEYVTLNPTPGEGQLLEQARGIGTAPAVAGR